jgi:hypothetical protein
MAVAAMLLATVVVVPPGAGGPDDLPPAESRAAAAPRHGQPDPAAAALLAQVAQAWHEEAAEALRGMLAPGDIRFRLDPPGADDAARGGDAPMYSAAQVFYMLQNHFAAVRTVSASLERRVASAASDQAHGVLEVQWMADANTSATQRRLFVELRRLGNQWRVVEVRALP